MAAPPARTELVDTAPNPTNSVAKTGFGKLYDYVTGLLGATGDAAEARAALAALGTAGGTLTGALNEAHGADIASASTINLTTATGNLVDITGTTTITAITLAEGAERTVRFTGALTLTNGASLVLMGLLGDITTAAEDMATFRGYAAGVVRLVHYTRKSGAPLYNAPSSETVSGIVELATVAEAQTGTDTARAVTPAGLAAVALGVGQTWQDLTGSRAFATNYTNTSGKPISVHVHGTSATSQYADLAVTVGGVVLQGTNVSFESTAQFVSLSFIVPNGVTYNVAGTNATLTKWNELRA